MSILKTLLALIVLGYLFFGALLFMLQRTFLYYPTAEYSHNFLVEEITNEGQSLKIIVLNTGKKAAILYFGGNAESVVHSAPELIGAFSNHTIYLINYRGYGGSTGTPSEQALYSDALAAYDRVASRHDNLALIGRSLGSGVVTHLAAKRLVQSIVLITPYDSIENMAKSRFPIYPISILLKDKFNSIECVADIDTKALVILAENDNIIPRRHSLNLIKSFPKGQVVVKTIANSGHNNLSNTEEYYSMLRNFISKPDFNDSLQ